MAGDVAQLGLAVSSDQVTAATAALQKMTAASAAAAKGADNLAQAGTKSETQMRAIESAAKRAGVSTAEMTARTDAFNAASNRMVVSQGKAVQAIVGLSDASKKGANDNNALTAATDKTTSAFDKFSSRLTRGVIASAVGLAVRDLARYLFDLNTQLAATADTAQRVGVGGQQFQGLQTAAAYKGVSNDSFNSAMLAFNQQIDLAKHGLGDLQALLRLNGKTVTDTAGTFGIVADLVKNAASEAQKFSILQQAGLPASREFVKLMEQGADSITRQGIAAAKLRDSQLEDAQRLDDRWQKLWTDFTNWGKKAALDVGIGISNIPTPFAHQGTWLGQRLQGMGIDRPEDPNSARNQGLNLLRQGQGTQLGSNSAADIYNSTGAFGKTAQADKTKSVQLEKELNAQSQARLAILGPLLTVDEQVRQTQLQLAAAGLNLTGVNDRQAKALINLTRAQAELSQIQAKAQIGVFDLGQATAQAGHELQGWIDRKLLDPTNTEQMAAAQNVLAKRIRDTSDAAAVAGSRLPQLTQLGLDAGNAFKQIDTFGVSSMNALSDSLVSVGTGSAKAGDAFKNFGITVLTALEKMIVQMTIMQPLVQSLGLGGGGLLSLFGIGGGAGGAAQSASAATLAGNTGGAFFGPGFADGGTLSGGWGVVGERGPELINVHSRGVTVIPSHVSRPYLPGFAEGGMLSAGGNVTRLPGGQDNSPMYFSFAPNIDARGADAAAVARIANVVAKQQRDFERNVQAVVGKTRQNRPGAF